MKPGRYTNWHTRRVGYLKVSMRPKQRTPYTILRVDQLIDIGRGQPMVILKNALPDFFEVDLCTPEGAKIRVDLPQYASGLNCVYTGGGFGVITDVVETLQAVVGRAKLAAIVPDVIRPGDFMLYRHNKNGMRFAGVLRAVPEKKIRDSRPILSNEDKI